MKQFLTVVNEFIGALEHEEISDELIMRVAAGYQRLSEQERSACLAILDDALDIYMCRMIIFSTLLCASEDKKIHPYIEKTLADSAHSLWERINDLWQWHMSLFHYPALYDQWEDYRNRRRFYGILSEEIRNLAGKSYPYLPYRRRTKSVVVTVLQLLAKTHAPTNIVRYFCKCLQDMGYDVFCFVEFVDAAGGCWSRVYGWELKNFCHQTAPFQYIVGGGNSQGIQYGYAAGNLSGKSAAGSGHGLGYFAGICAGIWGKYVPGRSVQGFYDGDICGIFQ